MAAAAEMEAADRQGKTRQATDVYHDVLCCWLLDCCWTGDRITTNGFRANADFQACKNNVGASIEVVQFFICFFASSPSDEPDTH